MNKGIFAVDPGGSTGLAWGVFDPKLPVEEVFNNGLLKGSTTVTGTEYEQIREIAEAWFKFFRSCVREHCMEPTMIEYVCEDFILAPGAHPAGRDSTAPERIMWGVEGYRLGRADQFMIGRRGKQVAIPRMIRQQASQAKSYATPARMKNWGIWVRGKEHERSAWAHVALRLASIKKHMG